jgi:hypothetical protein
MAVQPGVLEMDKSEQPPIPNAHYEALLRMRENNPSAWHVLSPNTKAAVQYYEIARLKFEQDQQMRREDGLPPAA